MLSKKNLLNREEIRFLTSQKINPIQGQYFGLIFRPSQDSKFGIIVSNKISNKAVQRNRIKRLLLLAVKESKLFGLKGNFLFLAKKNSIFVSISETERDLEIFREKLRI